MGKGLFKLQPAVIGRPRGERRRLACESQQELGQPLVLTMDTSGLRVTSTQSGQPSAQHEVARAIFREDVVRLWIRGVPTADERLAQSCREGLTQC